jgi:dihydrofolate reductase
MAGMDDTRPLVSIIAALSENRVIGRDNKLPWHLPADLARFKRLTLNKPILMGRRTWESLPGILPRRQHVVVTRDRTFAPGGCLVVPSPEMALSAVAKHPEVMVIGGAALYRSMLPMVTRMYLTLVHTRVEDGDAFFPEWNSAAWEEVEREERPRDGRNAYDLSFVELVRR